MAGIDKTYTDSYSDYKEFKDWADTQVVEFFDGHKECVGDWVWEYEKPDFDNGEIPIMNTPTWLDFYLIQNCKSEFVLKRMSKVYSEKSYESAKKADFKKLPEHYKQNRKVKIQYIKKVTKFPIHNKVYGGKSKWWLQSTSYSYNEETKIWCNCEILYPTYTNTAEIKTVKSIIRHLRKQFLPKGIEFELIGRYVGERYLIKIK